MAELGVSADSPPGRSRIVLVSSAVGLVVVFLCKSDEDFDANSWMERSCVMLSTS